MLSTVVRKLAAFFIELLCAWALQAGDVGRVVTAIDRYDFAS